MKIYDCEIDFNIEFLTEDSFKPDRTENVYKTARYNFYGIRNSPFKLNLNDPISFLNQYMEYVVKNDRVASVVGSLHYSDLHDLVFDVDIKPGPDIQKHLEIEQYIVNLLLKILAPVRPRIYVLAKHGGKNGIGCGLHLHIPNIVMTRLDNLALTYVLKEYVDCNLTNWSMPFSTKSGNIEDSYFPYKLYVNDESDVGVTKFSKLDYVHTFGRFLYHCSFNEKNVYTFPMSTNEQHKNFIPILKSRESSIGKNLGEIVQYTVNDELSLLQEFINENVCYEWIEDFPGVNKLKKDLETTKIYDDSLKDFMNRLYPINIHDVTNFVQQDVTKQHALTYTLFYFYGNSGIDVIKSLSQTFQIEETVEKLKSNWTELNNKFALEVFKILVFENLEPLVLDPFSNSIPYIKKGSSYITLSDLAIQLVIKEKIHPKDIAPLLSPIVMNETDNVFYYMWNEWHQLTNSKSKDHLFNSKIKLFALYLQTKEEDKEKKADNKMYKELIESSKQFWDTFAPISVPKHIFPFVDGCVWDFKYRIKTKTFPLWVTTEKSFLSSTDIDFSKLHENDDNLYFSHGKITKYPHIYEYILQIMNNDLELADYLVYLITLIITGQFVKYLICFYGPTANNGKTTFLKILNILLGDMYTSMNLKTLHKGIESTNDDIKRASKARIVTVDEINQKQSINSMIVKVITGHSSIFVRGIYEKGGMVEFNGCLVIAANGMPLLEISDAIISRFIPIPFEAQFENDGKTCFSEMEKYRLASELFLLCADRFYNKTYQVLTSKAVEKLKLSLVRALDEIYSELQELGLDVTHNMEDTIEKTEVMEKIFDFNKQNTMKKDPLHLLNRISKVVLKSSDTTLYGLTENVLNKQQHFNYGKFNNHQ